MGTGEFINKTLYVGLQGSGKSYAIKKVHMERDPDTFTIDPLNEHPESRFRYIPKHTDFDGINKEVELAINNIIIPNCNVLESKKRYKEALNTVIFDEADLYFKSGQKISPIAQSFFVKCRHYMLSNVVSASRRLMDINYYVRNTADFIVAFKQSGADDLSILNKMAKGADKVMESEIEYGKRNFILFDRSRNFVVMDDYNELTKAGPAEDWATLTKK
ncbi:hypothetical protein MmiEs2_04940 [Methanimicrococcus stummii]|uniref:Uncharacterized protein n=1 Tax=Methanimicrococcus stummii TaxID=3028294 RepID=A0AA96ZWX7_9EURY|nr:hypothetical protein [Methanimicrococcus sp. Es2]WNY28309.1 hypothetical protein MmiEs2_04940 [Methanimicrococcus sp. Es2]